MNQSLHEALREVGPKLEHYQSSAQAWMIVCIVILMVQLLTWAFVWWRFL